MSEGDAGEGGTDEGRTQTICFDRFVCVLTLLSLANLTPNLE